MTVRVFQRDETVPVWAYTKDADGNYMSPDNGVEVTITDPDGTVKVDSVLMTLKAVGQWAYYYQSQTDDTPGWWYVSCKAQDGTGGAAKYVITKAGFRLQ